MSTIETEVRDRVLYARLHRPEAMNAIDEELLSELGDVTERCEADRDLRALVLSGTGDAFCVGLDLHLLERAFDDLEYFRDVLDAVNAALLGLERLDLPVIAAVNGTTRAGGFELLLACDLVVVADEARIADHHIHFGVAPGGGASQRAPRKLGSQRATELLLTGRWLTGAEAVEYGIAVRSVPMAHLDAAVEEFADRFRELSRDALGTVKGMVRDGRDLPLEEGIRLETQRFIGYLRDSADGREGFRAYQEGRQPAWAGSGRL